MNISPSKTFNKNASKIYITLIIIAFIITFGHFLLYYNVFYSTSDEGYLWYNVLMIQAGKIPILDIQSYDPFRFYFCILVTLFFGSGIIGIRVAMTIVQFFSIYVGLLIFNRVNKKLTLHLILAFVMVLWFFPYHKSMDIALSVFSIYFALILLENKEKGLFYLIYGVFTGFSAFIGRNAGLYNIIIFLGLFSIIWIQDKKMFHIKFIFKKLALWSIGIFIGYLPMIIMFITLPKFFQNYVDINFDMINRGSSNLPLPIPWPFIMLKAGIHNLWDFSIFLTGLYFVFFPIIYIAGLIYGTLKKNEYILVCSITGIIYMHYAFSRADLGHVAHSVLPLMLLIFGIASMTYLPKIATWLTIILTTVDVIFSAGLNGRVYLKFATNLENYELPSTKELILTPQDIISLYSEYNNIKLKYMMQGKELLIAPYFPGVYPMLGLECPVYYTYFLHKAPHNRQLKAIEDIKQNDVKYIILSNSYIDGREELSFQNTFNLVYDYIYQEFTPSYSHKLPDGYTFFIRTDLLKLITIK